MRSLRFAVAAVTSCALVAGCTSGGGAASHTSSPGRSSRSGTSRSVGGGLGSGAAPAGAVPDATTPDSALLAPAVARPSGTIEQQAAALAEEAAGSGPSAQGALRTALQLGGVDLRDVGGTVAVAGYQPKLGLQIPTGEVLLAAGQNTDAHERYASDFAGVLATMIGKKADPIRLRQALLDGLRDVAGVDRPGAASPYPKPQHFLAAFTVDLGLHARPAVDLATAGIDDVRFTGLQSWLLWILLASGFAQAAKLVQTGHPAPAPSPAGFDSTATAGNCTISDTTGKILDIAAIGLGINAGGIPYTAFGGLAGLLGSEEDPSTTLGAGEYLGAANAALSIARLIVEGSAFTAELSMLGGQPLMRTMSTSQPGEPKQLMLHATFDIGKGQYANCLRTAINTAGLDFNVPNDGPITDASVQWEMTDDPAGELNDPTEFFTTIEEGIGAPGDSVQTKTDANGYSHVGLEGRPQRYKLPPNPDKYMRSVRVMAELQPRSDTLYNDVYDAVQTFLGGPVAGIGTLISSIVDRTHWLSAQQTFAVQDWVKDFEFDGYFQFNNGAGVYPSITGLKCDGLGGQWGISINHGPPITFTLDDNGDGTADLSQNGIGGPTRIHYNPGPPPTLEFENQAATQAFTLIPGNFCDN